MLLEWKKICESLFKESPRETQVFEDFLNDVIFEPKHFQIFFQHACKGQFYQFSESHFIHMPANLMDDGIYEGSVEISWNNFDENIYLEKIRLDKFCFYVELAAVFHSQHVDRSFDPWAGFPSLHKLQNQFSSAEGKNASIRKH